MHALVVPFLALSYKPATAKVRSLIESLSNPAWNSTKHFPPGSFKYAGSFGVRSLNDAQPAQPLKEDAIHHIASCVKLITAVAVMQCVENGKLSLDDDVSTILYEFKDIDILTGYDKEGRPQYKKATRKITLRCVI